MSEPSKKGCKDCNKSTLALLLLRPSPIALAEPLVPVGTQGKVTSDDGLVKGLIPARVPTESRTVLRLLRTGYVYVYLPAPPPGIKNWLVYRVTDNADLIPETSAEFKKTPMPAVCSSSGHNAIGMRLLGIPRAAEISSVWIAYSANLWSDTLKTQNAANPQAMQLLPLGATNTHSFAPTAASLQSKVLECAVPELRVNGDTEHDFPFNSLAKNVDALATQLQRAAACHPKTTGKELAVVLADPVGYATELNGLRLRRHALAQQEMEKPENAHPLNSSNALMGLKKVMLDANALESFEQVSPLRTKSKYAAESWPAGTEWQALTPEDRKTLLGRASDSILLKPYQEMFARADMGRVIYPDHDVRAAAWAKKNTEATWAKLAPHYDEVARVAWVKSFEAKLKAQHYEPLAKFEQDWCSASLDPLTLACFRNHFDPKDPNSPLNTVCGGKIYADECQRIYQPAPCTTGAVLDTYLAMLDRSIKDEAAIVLRALVGNQQAVIDVVHTQLTGDAGADGMRDKSYDFLKGVLGLELGSKAVKKYGWMGDALSMFSVGQLSALSGALMSSAGRSNTVSAALEMQLRKVQGLWGVQQAIEYAAGGALHGSAPKMPVLLHMRVDTKEALALLRARKGQSVGTSKSRIKKQGRQNAQIMLTLLTDTEALKAAQGDVHKMLQDPTGGSVSIGQGTKTTAVAGGTAVLNEQQFLRLYAQQSTLGTQAVNAVRQSLKTGAGAQVKAISITMDGRLAIGSVVAQGIGLINGLNALSKAGTGNEVRDAWYGIFDSTAGVLGGLLEMWAVAAQASTVAKAGQAVAVKSLGLGTLRFVANIAGMAGGMVNAAGAWSKANDAVTTGDVNVAQLYRYSSFTFGGTAVTSAAIAVGAAGDTLVARSIGGAVARNIAMRVGVQGVLMTVGGTALTVSGIGLVLLGAGMALQVGAVAMTPTPIQRWMSRSYFGKDPSWLDWDGKRDDMFTRGNWPSEYEALQKAIEEGGKEADAPKAEAPVIRAKQ
nr:T6SS effector BTH_I2691 family protein [uncultured Albidiferax sp.]